jgi:ring-1,2-phenylacetyl-CoA epoxidase subunit PaaD
MNTRIEQVRNILESVEDPEIPVLTIADLGILRDVEIQPSGKVIVTITPTYSGCPAMQAIEIAIKSALQEHNLYDFEIKTVLSPAWTTDWLTEAGRQKLLAYGIAPPVGSASKRSLLGESPVVGCPQCGSTHTELISEFGSTSCKALWRCLSCREPFDYFKCH